MLFQHPPADFHKGRVDQIITVKREDQVGDGIFDTKVSCAGNAPVFLVQDPDAGVFFGIFRQEIGGAGVGAAVVDNDPFKPGKSLVHDTVECLFKIPGSIVKRGNDAHKRSTVGDQVFPVQG